jgi:transcription elongation factor GreA
LVSPAEANPMEGKISVQSPLGKAITGKKSGEKVAVNAPDGMFTVEILSIE